MVNKENKAMTISMSIKTLPLAGYPSRLENVHQEIQRASQGILEMVSVNKAKP